MQPPMIDSNSSTTTLSNNAITQTATESEPKSNDALVGGIVGGVIALLLICVVVVVLLGRRSRRRRDRLANDAMQMQMAVTPVDRSAASRYEEIVYHTLPQTSSIAPISSQTPEIVYDQVPSLPSE